MKKKSSPHPFTLLNRNPRCIHRLDSSGQLYFRRWIIRNSPVHFRSFVHCPDQIHRRNKEEIQSQTQSDCCSYAFFVLFRDLIFQCSFRR